MNTYLIVKIAGNVQVAATGVTLSSTLEQYSKDHPRVISANTAREALAEYKNLSKPKKVKTLSKREQDLQELRKSMKNLDSLSTIYVL